MAQGRMTGMNPVRRRTGSVMMSETVGGPSRPIRVLSWSERTEPESLYPAGINGVVAQILAEAGHDFETRVTDLADPDQGVSEADLEWADVLVWFSHLKHRQVEDATLERILRHVQQRGMGFLPLHSSLDSRPFQELLGHPGRIAGWREDEKPSHVWVVQKDHPVAAGLGDGFVIPAEEMYAEPFNIPPPDELVFISSFAGGEVFRSGCCWYRGAGRMFFFQPGHETYPVYYQAEVRRAVMNGVRWCSGR